MPWLPETISKSGGALSIGHAFHRKPHHLRRPDEDYQLFRSCQTSLQKLPTQGGRVANIVLGLERIERELGQQLAPSERMCSRAGGRTSFNRRAETCGSATHCGGPYVTAMGSLIVDTAIR